MATFQLTRGAFTARATAPRPVLRQVAPVAPRCSQACSFLGGEGLRRGSGAGARLWLGGAHWLLAWPVETVLEAPSAGMKVTMMRHGNRVKHLGRPADQRKALIRSLVTEVIRYGAIRTTKVLRLPVGARWGHAARSANRSVALSSPLSPLPCCPPLAFVG